MPSRGLAPARGAESIHRRAAVPVDLAATRPLALLVAWGGLLSFQVAETLLKLGLPLKRDAGVGEALFGNAIGTDPHKVGVV